MTQYDLDPKISRMFLFHSEGGALAAVKFSMGPISIDCKLYKKNNGQGYFLSLPSRRSEAKEQWYDLVVISDPHLLQTATTKAVAEYERLSRSELVAV